MKINKKETFKQSGVYSITCLKNGRVYIGQSIQLHIRFSTHRSELRYGKHINPGLQEDFIKYGEDNFVFNVLEYCLEDLCDREAYWMSCYTDLYNISGDCYNMTGPGNPNFGNKWSDEQKAHASQIQKERHASGLYYGESFKQKQSDFFKSFWKDNPEVKATMALKVKESKKKYIFDQFDSEGKLVKTWNSIEEIIQENPAYKWQNIYSVCNGYKKRMYGFVWKKRLKI